MNHRTIRERMLRGQADADDSQPFRCVKCGEAVSIIRRNHCACTRALQSTACARADHCVLQRGHMGECSPTFTVRP